MKARFSEIELLFEQQKVCYSQKISEELPPSLLLLGMAKSFRWDKYSE